MSDRELKRLSREMAGHAKDKDRARRRRRAAGEAPARGRGRDEGGRRRALADEPPDGDEN